MARDKLTEYSATASENTVCGDVNIAENSALPSDLNNFAREVMSHLKAFSDGTDAIDALAVDNLKLDGNTISSTDTNGDIALNPNGSGSVTSSSGHVFLSGMLVPYAGTSAPTGWLLCYGQAVSRSTYADLFSAISTTYGSGDGSSTFNLPDLRGRTVAGKDDMGGSSANRLTDQSGGLNGDTLGDTGGAETHTLTTAQMPSHNHTQRHNGTSGGIANQMRSGGGASAQTNSINTTTNKGSGNAHNNVQPTIILNYIIKT